MLSTDCKVFKASRFCSVVIISIASLIVIVFVYKIRDEAAEEILAHLDCLKNSMFSQKPNGSIGSCKILIISL